MRRVDLQEGEDVGAVMDKKRSQYGKQMGEMLNDEDGLDVTRENMGRKRKTCDVNSIIVIIRRMRDGARWMMSNTSRHRTTRPSSTSSTIAASESLW